MDLEMPIASAPFAGLTPAVKITDFTHASQSVVT
jgi:hypothetical protein